MFLKDVSKSVGCHVEHTASVSIVKRIKVCIASDLILVRTNIRRVPLPTKALLISTNASVDKELFAYVDKYHRPAIKRKAIKQKSSNLGKHGERVTQFRLR